MKTAISIPDEVFGQAEQLAQRLGISRSELYVRALRSYLAARHDDLVTRELDALYGEETGGLDESLGRMQSATLAPWL